MAHENHSQGFPRSIDPESQRVPYDVAILGGGPSGLSAALALGRARKRVLLCDAGPRRNAAAVQIHNFVTRDGTPPDEFRRVAREQLAHYPSVEVRDVRVESIAGARGAFRVDLKSEMALARRVLLCTGMVDEMLLVDGFRELWGSSIFQCPYCHGWEAQDRRWGFLALTDSPHLLPFALMLRGWTEDVVVFTGGSFEVPEDMSARLAAARIRVETAKVTRLIAREKQLEAVELSNGTRVPRDVLFTQPPQRQVELVQSLGIALDADGYIRTDPMSLETSVPGIYASGDLTTRAQGAILAAASGMQAAARINVDLSMDPAIT